MWPMSSECCALKCTWIFSSFVPEISTLDEHRYSLTCPFAKNGASQVDGESSLGDRSNCSCPRTDVSFVCCPLQAGVAAAINSPTAPAAIIPRIVPPPLMRCHPEPGRSLFANGGEGSAFAFIYASAPQTVPPSIPRPP